MAARPLAEIKAEALALEWEKTFPQVMTSLNQLLQVTARVEGLYEEFKAVAPLDMQAQIGLEAALLATQTYNNAGRAALISVIKKNAKMILADINDPAAGMIAYNDLLESLKDEVVVASQAERTPPGGLLE